MKNTIKIKKVGSRSIIDGFVKRTIDTQMTGLSNKKVLSELPEQQAVDQKVAVKNGHNIKARNASSKMRVAKKRVKDAEILLTMTDSEEEKSYINITIERANAVFDAETKNLESFNVASKGCDVELDELGRACDVKRKSHIKANPIYCHPGKNQVAVSDEKCQELKALFDARENQQIALTIETEQLVVLEEVGKDPITAPFLKLISHEVIADFRGCQYFYLDLDENWVASEVITDLGVTMETVVVDEFHGSAIESKDLNDGQREEIRVQGLTVEGKDAEKAAAIDSSANAAGSMKTKLEIQGSTAAKALTDSKAWYQIEVDKIEVKYG